MKTETPTRADDPVSSALVAACEQAWSDIKGHHPELPDAVIVLGTGIQGGRLVKLGHWWQSQWLADGHARAEVLLAGEALHLPAEDVMEILLHEAAHGINSARGIKDTSRGGRYHNGRFRTTATEVGLLVERADPYGWAKTSLPPGTVERYGDTIERIKEHLRIARNLPLGARRSTGDNTERTGAEQADDEGRGGTVKNPAAECACGRKMRMADSVLAQGPVVCGLCRSEFAKPRQAAHTTAASPATGDDFLRRRASQAASPSPDRGEEGQQHLDAIERALRHIAANGDAEPLSVFERERPGLERWFDDLISAEILHLPTAHYDRAVERDLDPEVGNPRAGIEGVEP